MGFDYDELEKQKGAHHAWNAEPARNGEGY